MKRIRIQKPRPRRESPGREVLPPDPQDPDVVRAKALARGGGRGNSRVGDGQDVAGGAVLPPAGDCGQAGEDPAGIGNWDEGADGDGPGELN